MAAFLVSAALFAAACSGGDSNPNAAQALELTTTVATTAAPATTTPPTVPPTTEAPTTTEAPATTTTEPPPPPPPVYPLTGVLEPDPAILARPALVVKIDNANGARPQTGFNSADIVVEEIVNDNLTRFAMVFHSQGSDPVGPIRSGRIQDIDLFGSFNHPLFAWSGGNKTVTDAIRASDLVEIGPSRAAVYFRSNRKAPHNLYSNTTALWGYAPVGAGPPQQQFTYRAPDAPVQGVPSPGAFVTLDSINVQWTWDPATGLYYRDMEGKDHQDAATGQQVSTNNVVILEMNYLPGISGSPDAQTLGTGVAHVLTAGNWIQGTWFREDRLLPFTLTADDGSIMQLTPGRTFIELPRVGNTLVLPPA